MAGKEGAFAALIAQHRASVLGFIRRRVLTADEADDLLQETFIAFWRSLDLYDCAQPLGPWLRRIALNKCRDRIRRRAGYDLMFCAANLELDLVADEAPDAERNQIARDAWGHVSEAVRRLPDSLREPLLLTSVDALSYREAGARLGLSSKAVEMRIYHARKALALVHQ